MHAIFAMKQDKMEKIIKILKEQGFIVEGKIKNEGIKYQVENVAKIWYELLLVKTTTLEILATIIPSLSTKQIKAALEEGIEKGIIAKRDKFFYTVS